MDLKVRRGLPKCGEGQKVRKERKNKRGRDWQRLRVSDFNRRKSKDISLCDPSRIMCTGR